MKVNEMLDTETQRNISSWLEGPYDEKSKAEIRQLQESNPEELLDAFYTHLSFGTGGLRGKMGVGTNRMNAYTVAAATQGLANYLKKCHPHKKKISVFIGYDVRHNSYAFSEVAASVLAANNIEVFLFKEFRPVASISFGLLHQKCDAGIMITASHNPPIYNGYKVYWSHGGQVLPPHDQGIIEQVNKITSPDLVKKVPLPHPLVIKVAEEIDQPYLQVIHSLQLHEGTNRTHGKELKVVYSPLHGGGITMVPPGLKLWGFTNLTLVEAQQRPDGDFPTVKTPNPEENEALNLGIETLQKVKGDILLATDPDSDRLGVVIMHQNALSILNGNEVGALLLEHICASLKGAQLLPPKATAVKTIVTSELFKAIATHYGVTTLDVLTGFKYIGEKIAAWESEAQSGFVTSHHFIFGAEESLGYLYGTHSRDKDAIIAATLICELALQLKLEGKTLLDALYALYQRYGVYREKLLSLTFDGKEGATKISTLMEKLRTHPLTRLGECPIETCEDYQSHTLTHLESGHKQPLILPKSNVLRYFLLDQTKIVIRPSGTEPKIKLYVACFERPTPDLTQALVRCDKKVDNYIALLRKELGI